MHHAVAVFKQEPNFPFMARLHHYLAPQEYQLGMTNQRGHKVASGSFTARNMIPYTSTIEGFLFKVKAEDAGRRKRKLS